jgi:SAM-dependent methyltransferase
LLDKYEQNLPHFSRAEYPNVSFQCLPMELYRSQPEFDLVFCMNAINHVRDVQLSFDILVNALKPGGKLVITIDAHNYSFYKGLFRAIPGDILHPHQYDMLEYRKMLSDRGCSILECIQLKREYFFNHYMLVAEKLK